MEGEWRQYNDVFVGVAKNSNGLGRGEEEQTGCSS